MKAQASRTILGKRAEEIACRRLMQEGHTIIEKNWRTGHLEIDIISIDKKGIHFVEVKSRTAPIAQNPENNVTIKKQKNIVKAALKYITSKTIAQEIYFDIIAIIFDGEKCETTYIPQAYIPIYT